MIVVLRLINMGCSHSFMILGVRHGVQEGSVGNESTEVTAECRRGRWTEDDRARLRSGQNLRVSVSICPEPPIVVNLTDM